MQKDIELIALIYKSKKYLHHIISQMKSDKTKVEDWDVHLRILANDANDIVLEELKNLDIPYTIYNDKNPEDYYINRVYRAHNYAAQTSKCSHICFINSDIVVTQNWFQNLLNHYERGKNIPCPRLIESQKMPSGLHCVEKNFGRHPDEILFDELEKFANQIRTKEVKSGGVYCCPIFDTKLFIKTGMYPEGNIYIMPDGSLEVGAFSEGKVYKSGDTFYFEKLEKLGLKHQTCFDSILYHIQEGEKDLTNTKGEIING